MNAIKICGVRNVAEAAAAHAAGADWIGLNFVPGRARAVTLSTAHAILAAVPGRFVGVLADPSTDWLEAIRALPVHALQLHGAEPPSLLAHLLEQGVDAFKAIAVRGVDDVRGALRYPGARILFDAAAVGTQHGGLGVCFDWSWLSAAPSDRPYWIAGGLTPDNVTGAVLESLASGVDVASGVETASVKDADKMRTFVERARLAFDQRSTTSR